MAISHTDIIGNESGMVMKVGFFLHSTRSKIKVKVSAKNWGNSLYGKDEQKKNLETE